MCNLQDGRRNLFRDVHCSPSCQTGSENFRLFCDLLQRGRTVVTVKPWVTPVLRGQSLITVFVTSDLLFITPEPLRPGTPSTGPRGTSRGSRTTSRASPRPIWGGPVFMGRQGLKPLPLFISHHRPGVVVLTKVSTVTRCLKTSVFLVVSNLRDNQCFNPRILRSNYILIMKNFSEITLP